MAKAGVDHGRRYLAWVRAVLAFRTPRIFIQRNELWLSRDSFYPIPWVN